MVQDRSGTIFSIFFASMNSNANDEYPRLTPEFERHTEVRVFTSSDSTVGCHITQRREKPTVVLTVYPNAVFFSAGKST
jgi:hypothetical protein